MTAGGKNHAGVEIFIFKLFGVWNFSAPLVGRMLGGCNLGIIWNLPCPP
jgi:hypothetical protein